MNDLSDPVDRLASSRNKSETVSIAYVRNILDVSEKFDAEDIFIAIGSIKLRFTILFRAVVLSCWP